MSAANRKSDVRHENDAYETPAWATRALVKTGRIPAGATVLDLGCGSGGIGNELLLHGYGARGVDNDPHGFKSCSFPTFEADVLTWTPPKRWGGVRVVVMNPPYVLALPFVQQARSFVGKDGYVFALLRMGFLEGEQDSERLFFHRNTKSDFHVFHRRPSFTKGGHDACTYAWFEWSPRADGRWTLLDCEPAERRPRAPR